MADLRLGGFVDPASHARTGTDVLLPSNELTTHGVIVGMTGSGKTGLGIVLIEEALRAGVPALLIDPKGDLANLALTFPDLSAAQFQPWVDPAAATRAGQSVPDFAAAEAGRWAEGLAGWGLGAADVAALHEAAPVTIHTPAAEHGVPLNIIGSLDAPADMSDEAVADEIEAYVSSLLNLVGIEADPLSSREHILLSTLIQHAWGQGRSLDLATLVASVQQPPVRKVGVLELDTYYPADERMKLVLRLNGLLASPAFAAWLGGQRIDIEAMLRTPDGRPRCAVITTAHLSDEQRQSVTSVVLAKVVSWMRRQSGTSGLRALLYLDEVAGYLPPVGNPPTKEPLMLLLKQARAFGVGVVLSTQNPVDVDYKALSNAGTWLVGRLQTEQDKSRLMDGLTSASGSIDPRAVGDTISGLGKREFVLKRASRDTAEVLTTRWAMSYLRGPMTRDQVAALTAQSGSAAPAPQPAATGSSSPAGTSGADAAAPAGPATTGPSPTGPSPTQPGPSGPALAADETPVPPKVAAGVPVSYLDPAAAWAGSVGAVPGHRLAPAVIARVHLRFDEAKADLTHDEEYEAVLFPLGGDATPAGFRSVDYDDRDLLEAPPADAAYQLAPPEVASKAWWSSLRSALADHLYRSRTVQILRNADLKLYGRVGETDVEFGQRCARAAADAADRETAALTGKYERKLAGIERRLGTARDAAARAEAARTSTMASDLIGGLFGGRRSVGASMRRASTAQARVNAAADRVADLHEMLAEVQAELEVEVGEIRRRWADRAAAVSTLEVPLEKSDVRVASIGLVWIPTGT